MYPWSAARRLTLLLVLCVVAAINLIDRQLISILMEPIKRDFRASDTMMGLLTGLSFATVYATAALPIARWSDRSIRRNVIAGCLLVWGGMTMLCGVARSYLQLAAARMGVALGEAGYNPAAHSMIADLYPVTQRGRAIGVFNAAASIGIGFGLFFGGWLNHRFDWRVVFLIVGAPCLLISLLFRVWIDEPPRGMSDGRSAPILPPSLGETLRALGGTRSFRFLALSAMTCAFVNYGLQIWAASFFIRVHGMSTQEVGLKLGLASAVGLFLATIGSGTLADRLGRLDMRWYMRVPGFGMLLTLPFGLLAFTSSGSNRAFGYYCITVGLSSTWAAPIHAMTQSLSAPRMRGIAAATISLCLNLFGYGLGPLFVGALNDRLRPGFGADSIRYSLMILLSGCLLAAASSFATNASIRRDLAAGRIA
jgi:predicted MFS family arabinose efflux permease